MWLAVLHGTRASEITGRLLALTVVVLAAPPTWAQATAPEGAGPEATAPETTTPEPATPDPAATGAGTAEITDLSLDDLLNAPITTASGEVEQRSVAAATVHVVTSFEIERRGWRTLQEILQQVPGIYLVDDHVHPSMGVREVTGGFRAGTRIVKIMIDGYPVSFRPDLNAFIGPEFIPVGAIERVEIAKGPLSALYGANAFLATVNVITRRPSAGSADVRAHTRVQRGRVGYGASVTAATGDSHRGLLVAFSSERSDRSGMRIHPTYGNQNPEDPVFGRISRNDLSSPQSAFVRLHHAGARLGEVVASAGYQHLDAGGAFQLNSVLTNRTRVSLHNRWASLQYARPWADGWKARVLLGAASGAPDRDYQLFLTGSTDSHYRPNHGYRAFNGLLEVSYSPLPALSVKMGLDGEQNRERVLYFTEVLHRPVQQRPPLDERDLIGNTDRRHATLHQLGTYLQASGSPLEDLYLTANGRVDFIEFGELSFPRQYSWRTAAAYRLSPRLTLKVVGGRAFQTPSGTLLFAHGAIGNFQNLIGSQRLDEPRPLRPQKVTSVDLVASGQLGRFLTLEVVAFHQRLTDAIEFVQLGPFYVAANRGRRQTSGLDLQARLTFLGWLHPYLQGSASGPQHDTPPSLYPRLIGRAGLDFETWRNRVDGNLELRWVGARGASQGNVYRNDSRPYTLPSYTEIDLTLGVGDVGLLDPQLQSRLLLSLRNAFDRRRMEPGFGGFDIPQLGRTLFVMLRQDL